MLEAGALGGQDHLHLELALAAEPLLANHPLDLLLRGHSHLFQVLPERHVEAMLVHGLPPFGALSPDMRRRSTYIKTNAHGGHLGCEGPRETEETSRPKHEAEEPSEALQRLCHGACRRALSRGEKRQGLYPQGQGRAERWR